jgi:hypothetical protein
MCIFSLLKLLLCSVMAELYQLLGRLSSITDDLCVVMYDVCENYYWDSSESTKTFILRLNYKLNDIQCIASYDFFKTRRVPDFRCTFKVNMYRREDKCWMFEEYEFKRGRFSYRIAYQKVKMRVHSGCWWARVAHCFIFCVVLLCVLRSGFRVLMSVAISA